MKQIQGRKTIGYVLLMIKGKHIEHFLERCVNNDIPMWDVKRFKNDQLCEAKIYLHHVKKVEELNNSFPVPYDIKFVKESGCLAFINRLIKKKQIVLATLISVLVLFIISNIIWSINVKGVSHEIEEKIKEQLSDHGIHVGSLIFSVQPLQSIQQNILNDIPELLWIGIEKRGTSYHIEGVEKKIAEQLEPTTPQHLVAKKSGVIEHMYIQKGLPLVNKFDYVKQGDMLVSGFIDQIEEDDDSSEEETEEKREAIRAKGEVFANTWYEMNITVPLDVNYDTLTGRYKTFYQIKLGKVHIPFWGIKKPKYNTVYKEDELKNVYFLKWKLPVDIVQIRLHELEKNDFKRTKEEAVQVAIKQAEESLQLQLGKDAEILSNFILHQGVDNGKVKLNLYMSVLENIALEQSIDEQNDKPKTSLNEGEL